MRVAFIQIRLMPDHYFFDTLNILYAGDLRKMGHDVRVFDHNTHASPEGPNELTDLNAAIEAFGAEVLIFDRIHSPDVVPTLRGNEVVAVGVLQQASGLGMPGVDFDLPHRDRAPVMGVIDALAREGLPGLGSVPGVRTTEFNNPFPHTPGVERLFEDFDLAYDLLKTIRVSPTKTPLRKHIFGNLGCPYRNAPNRTGFMEGVALPPELTARGCTFCDRPDYERIRPPKALELLRAQIQQVRSAFPSMDQLILVDEYGLRYVDEFVDLAIEEGLQDIELFFSARVEYILKFQQRFEKALEKAKGTLGLVMYLVGVENLSPFELWRFNKGLDVATIVDALGKLDEYASGYSHFRIEPSFGYIMFTPWSTPADLYLNLVYLQRLSFDRWRQSAVLTRLRLYPDNALYYRALHDGLLRKETPDGADASERYGYEAETPWIFKDSQTQAIYDQVYGAQHGDNAINALKKALRPHLAEIKAALASLDLRDPLTLKNGAFIGAEALARKT